MTSSPIPQSTRRPTFPSSSMFPNALTRRIARTETLGPGLVPVRPPPLFVSTTTIPHNQRKRRLEDGDEEARSRKRHCPSPGLCVYCGQPAEEPKSKNKENWGPSSSASTTSVSTPLPSLTHTAGPATPMPLVDSSSLCKAAAKKPVLTREVRKPVLRQQPFRRLPTAVNQERVGMRNNLRAIFLGRKAQPTDVRWARDTGPRPRLRGTYASNLAHRGELSQPAPECKAIKYSLRPPIVTSDDDEPMWFPNPSLFLGSGEREWVRDIENHSPPEEGPSLVGEVLPDLMPFMIRHKVSGDAVLVYPSVLARLWWRGEAEALKDLLGRRAAEDRKAGRTNLPASRWRGPDGKLREVQKFPIVPSMLRVELSRRNLEGGGEEGLMEVDAPEADRTDIRKH